MAGFVFIPLPFWEVLRRFPQNDKCTTSLRNKYMNTCIIIVIHRLIGWKMIRRAVWEWMRKKRYVYCNILEKRTLENYSCNFLSTGELCMCSPFPKGWTLLGKLMILSPCLHKHKHLRTICLMGNFTNISFIWF